MVGIPVLMVQLVHIFTCLTNILKVINGGAAFETLFLHSLTKQIPRSLEQICLPWLGSECWGHEVLPVTLPLCKFASSSKRLMALGASAIPRPHTCLQYPPLQGGPPDTGSHAQPSPGTPERHLKFN